MNGKIYILRSNQTNKVYIGSTTRDLKTRLIEHQSKYRRMNDYDVKKGIYRKSNEIMKHDDVYIELIKNYVCGNRKKLWREEMRILNMFSNAVNKI